jgi:ABC-type transport system involved in cytochrome c biogenesis permease subunit
MDLENFVYRTTVFGFVCLSVGLCLGGIWAKYAWGDHWFWDPKENWALISWLIYLAYLHARVVAGWRGRKSAAFAVIGGAAVLFTYLGMNYLPSAIQSVHVYQG